MSSSDPTPGTARLQGFLVVEAEGAQIDVQDAWMHPVVSGATGRLQRLLPAGAYQVSARIGDAEQSQLVVVRPAATARVVLKVRIDAAAPAYDTATENETHGMLLADLVSSGPSWPTLVVMLRGLKGHQMAPLDVPLTVLGARGLLPVPVPPPRRDTYTPDPDPRAIGWALALPQGGYRLRWPGPGGARPVEHAVWVSEGWQTIVFVPQGRHGPVPAGASVHLVERGRQWRSHDHDTLATERALAALREPMVTEIAPTSWTDLHQPAAPMLVLLTAHLIVRARAFGVFSTDPHGDRLRLTEAATELRAQLGPHPDVLALAAGLGLPDAASPSSWPPMLTASLDMLLAADDEAVPLIPPDSTVEAVTGRRFANRPLLLWDPSAGTVSHEEPIEWAGHGAMWDQFANVTPARSTIAVSRVRDLVSAVARRMDTDLADAASRLGTAEIAKRLGMARSLVRDCLTVINADDEGPLSL